MPRPLLRVAPPPAAAHADREAGRSRGDDPPQRHARLGQLDLAAQAGVFVTHGGDFVLTQVELLGNDAGLNGGGINAAGDLELYGVELRNNEAGVDGGGIHMVFATSDIYLEGGSVQGNTTSFFAATASV